MFRTLQNATRFSGGGGSSKLFLWSPEADAIQWGGGSSRNCSVVSGSRRDSVGGGVVADIFRGLQKYH